MAVTTSRTRTSKSKSPFAPMNKSAAKIPTPQCWQDYLHVLEAAGNGGVHRVLAAGIPGTGKTYSALTHGVKREEVVSIYVGEETAAYQITGMTGIRNGDTEWQDATGLFAWKHGQRLVINEVDKASGDALDAIIWLLDDPETAQITLPNGEVRRPAPGFHVVATTNISFEELQQIHPAVADRFAGCVVNIDRPHPEAVMALPVELWKAALGLTSADVAEEQRVTIRQFRGFVELCEAGVPVKTAARCAFHDRAAELLASIRLGAAA